MFGCRFALGPAVAGILVSVTATAAENQWDSLAAKAPRSTNAVVLVNVERLLESPIAKREGWRGKLENAFVAGMLALPPTAERVFQAAEIDYETFDPRFELAVVELNRDVSLANLARQTRGRPDVVADLEAVVLTQDAYIIALDKRHVAGISPANRQAAVRWLREVLHQEKPALTPYLMSAVEAAEKIDLVEALDMQDALPPDVIRAKLAASNVVSGAKGKVDLEKLVSLVTSLRGVTFEIAFKDQAHARFLIDFGQEAQPLATIGKPLLMEILRKQGAWIEDFDAWTPSVDKNRFVLVGTLSPTGLRKVLSLIDAPVATFTSPGDAPTDSGGKSAMAYASHAYFQALKSILADIRKESKDSVTLGQNAAWLDRWARKIERMPILNVDQDLLDYSAFVVARLRGASDSLKGIGINSAYRSAGVQDTTTGWVAGGFDPYYGRYVSYGGFFEENSGDSQRRAIRTEEKTKGAANALSNCRSIDEATAAIRRTLTARYQMEF